MTWNDVLTLLPKTVRQPLDRVGHPHAIEEIRLRAGKPIELILHQRHQRLSGHRVLKEEVQQFLERMAHYSLYSIEEELRRGFLTMPQGHRVGWVGQVTVEAGVVRTFRHVSGCNIRMARVLEGIADGIRPQLFEGERLVHTLIVSPPQCGKTTLLRDLVRSLSSVGHRTYKVGIVDERSELAACNEGVPTLNVGERTDVLDRCPKSIGMMMLIRSMSPEVIVIDELGSEGDAMAAIEAMHAGITLIASAHGVDGHDVRRRPTLQPLLGAIERFVVLDRDRVARIYDGLMRLRATIACQHETIS